MRFFQSLIRASEKLIEDFMDSFKRIAYGKTLRITRETG